MKRADKRYVVEGLDGYLTRDIASLVDRATKRPLANRDSLNKADRVSIHEVFPTVFPAHFWHAAEGIPSDVIQRPLRYALVQTTSVCVYAENDAWRMSLGVSTPAKDLHE